MSDRGLASGAKAPGATALRTRADDRPQDRAPDVPADSESIETRVRALECPDDWDGEGARGVTPETCEAAIAFLARLRVEIPGLPDPRSASPSVLGAVTFSWRSGAQTLVLEVASPPTDRLYHQWRGAHRERSAGPESAGRVIELLRAMYA